MTEVPITSAFDFLKLVHDFKENRNHPSEIEFYRGHADKNWRLLPSVYRQSMLSFEETLINEFLRRRPDEFSEKDAFSMLAKMQHYGLHTRLLDVTENPAVALYFACCEKDDRDGEVFLFQCTLDETPNQIVLNIITEFYVNHRDEFGNYNVEAYYEKIARCHKEKDVAMAFYFITNGYECFARPKVISERILRQSGSFMLFADEVCPKENCKNERCMHRNTERCKKDSVPKKYSDRVRSLSIKHTLRDWTDLHTKHEQRGRRYIVKAEAKKKLLYELQTIGISKAFLFPELSNEGAEVMMEYYSRINN